MTPNAGREVMDAATSLQGSEIEMAQQCLAVLATPATQSELDGLRALVHLRDVFRIELLPVQLRQVFTASFWSAMQCQTLYLHLFLPNNVHKCTAFLCGSTTNLDLEAGCKYLSSAIPSMHSELESMPTLLYLREVFCNELLFAIVPEADPAGFRSQDLKLSYLGRPEPAMD